METRNDQQLSLDFEVQGKAHVGAAASVAANNVVDRPRLQLVHSSNLPVPSSSEELRGGRIIKGILSHARSLSW